MSADGDAPSADGPRLFDTVGLDMAKDDPRIWAATWKAIEAAGFGKVERISRHAEGATAVVFSASRAGEPRRVALKIVLDPDDPRATKQFEQERKVLCQADLPMAVVRYFGCLDGYGGQPVLLLEYIHGKKLGDWARDTHHDREGRLTLVRVLFRLIAELRLRGIYWGDISPNNLLVDEQGRLRLIDAGQAGSVDFRSEHSITIGKPRGTPGYGAADVITGKRKPEPRDDVKAAARVAFLVLTRQPWPEDAGSAGALAALRAARVPRSFARLVVQAVAEAEDDGRRDRTNSGLAADVAARCDAWFGDRERRSRRRAVLAWTIPLVLVLAGLGGYAWWQLESERGSTVARTVAILERELADSPNRGHPALRTARDAIATMREAWRRAADRGAADADERRDRLLQSLRDALQMSHEIEAIAPLREAIAVQLANLPLVRSCPTIAARERDLGARFQALAEQIDQGDLASATARLRQLQTDLALLAKDNADAQLADQARLAWERRERGVAERLRALDGFRVASRRAAEAGRLLEVGQFTDARGPGATTEFGQARGQLEAFLLVEETPDERRTRLSFDASAFEDLERGHATLQTELGGVREQLGVLQSLLTRIEKERDDLVVERDALRRELAAAKTAEVELRGVLTGAEQQLAEERRARAAERDSAERRLAGVREELGQARAAGATLEQELAVARSAASRFLAPPDGFVVLQAEVDVAVVQESFATAIRATRLPWRIRHEATGIVMVLIPPGEYWRGAVDGDDLAHGDEKPRHRVQITKAFYLGETEVTNDQFRRFRANHDSGSYRWLSVNGNDQPVVGVSWNDATAFCRQYSMRLPTEAEWEYAARAGVSARFPWGSGITGEHANHGNVCDPTAKAKFGWDRDAFPSQDGHVVTAPARSYRANGLGLFDTFANVWEWCQDIYDAKAYTRYQAQGAVDPVVSASEGRRVLRGGAWLDEPARCRLSDRLDDDPGDSGSFVGFRVARTP